MRGPCRTKEYAIFQRDCMGRRYGLTLIEIATVLGIVGLLFALLIPAVQQTRQTARGIECQHRLRQIGTAVQNHIAQTSIFPDASFPRTLLPYLEQQTVYQRTEVAIIGTDPGKLMALPQFENVDIAAYRCPVDPLAEQFRGIVPSYRICSGTGFGLHDGVSGVRPQEITDGLSQTVAFSERLIETLGELDDADGSPHIRRRLIGYAEKLRDPARIDLFADACRDTPTWIPMQFVPPCYVGFPCTAPLNHLLPPNSHSCYNGPGGSEDGGLLSHAAITANSLHPGGVNALMADNAVRFVNESIDRNVWRALGTRAGGETVAAGVP